MNQVIPGLDSTRRRNNARTFSFFFALLYYLSIHMLSGMKYVWRSGPIFIPYRPGSEHGGNSKEKRSNKLRRFLWIIFLPTIYRLSILLSFVHSTCRMFALFCWIALLTNIFYYVWFVYIIVFTFLFPIYLITDSCEVTFLIT